VGALRDLIGLLPRGAAWNTSPDSYLGRLLTGLAAEFDRVEARAADLQREAFPLTADELLREWDAAVALDYPGALTGGFDKDLARAMIAWLLETSTLSRASIERFCALSEIPFAADGDGVTRPLYRLLGVTHTDTHEATIRLLAEGGSAFVEDLLRRRAHATGTLVFDWVVPAIAITSPADESIACDELVTVTGTSTGVGTVQVVVTESGGLVTTYTTTADSGTGEWSVQILLATYLDGEDTTIVARGYTGIVTAAAGWVESTPIVVTSEFGVSVYFAGPFTTTEGFPTFTGSATPGSTIVIELRGDQELPVVADVNGDWSVEMANQNLETGTNELTIFVTGPGPCEHEDSIVVEVELEAGVPVITAPPALAWTVAHGTSPAITPPTYTGDAGTITYDLIRLPSTTVLSGVSEATVEAYVSDRATDVGPSWKVTATVTNGSGSDSEDSNTVAWDPIATLAPVRWLEADSADITVNGSDDVTLWEDRSSAGVDMKGPSGPIPTYIPTDAALNNRGSVDFAAASSETLREDSIAADLRCLHDATGGTFVAVVDTDGAGTTQTLFTTSGVFTAANIGLFIRYTASGFRVGVCNGSGTFVADVTGAITGGAKGALIVRLDSSASPPLSVRWRGSQIASAGSLTGTPSTSSSTSAARLGVTSTLIQPWDGRVAQVGVVPDYVSGDALLDLERYCEWKWGL
jgi:hypothetical protein